MFTTVLATQCSGPLLGATLALTLLQPPVVIYKVTVYHSKEVSELIREKKVVTLKADLTQENPAAESLMHHLGSRSVPFFAVFPGDDPYNPLIMRDVVTKKSVMRVLRGLADFDTIIIKK